VSSVRGDRSLPVDGRTDVRYVAWHGGGSVTLRVGKRHLATVDAIEGRAPRKTLCGRDWRRSREVVPNDYWTTGGCSTCAAKLADLAPSLVGRTYRPDVGGPPLTVVAEDDRFVYVKRADDSKRALANPNGAQITTRAEIAAWTLLTEGPR
jgi:hypothetical protein